MRKSRDDITNISGNIQATNINLTSLNGDIINKRDSKAIIGEAGYYKDNKTFVGEAGEIKATNNLAINTNENFNNIASNLEAKNLTIKANDIQITTIEDKKEYSTADNSYIKSNETQHISSNLQADNIKLQSNDTIHIKGSNLQANNTIDITTKNLTIESAQNSKYKKVETVSKGSFGKKSKTTTTNSSITNLSSNIDAKNLTINTTQTNLIASKIKADTANITTDIINLISTKDTTFFSSFTDKSGAITRTIQNQGYVKEKINEAQIQVQNTLTLNNQDITNQLSNESLLKTLSSQKNIDNKTIQTFKQTINNKSWNDKKRTLSKTGALIVKAIVTYFTAGAGTGLVNAATDKAIQLAIDASINSMINEVTTKLVSSAITGNSFKLDTKSIVENSVKAGLVAGTNAYLTPEATKLAGDSQLAQESATVLAETTTQTVVHGGDFKENLQDNTNNAISKQAFKTVGDVAMQGELNGDSSWEDGGVKKTLLHSATGATVAALRGEDVEAGAVAAASRELVSPLTANSDEDTQLLTSQLVGITTGYATSGDEGAQAGYNTATDGEKYNRQLHQKEIEFINEKGEEFAKKLYGENPTDDQIQDAKSRLAHQGLRGVDKAWSLVLGEETDNSAQAFINNSTFGAKI